MASWIPPLLPLFESERAAGAPVALAVVLRTAGSTYRKAGALMLVARDGRYAGLLSGGCLESDLAEHARKVIESGVPQLVSYDLRNPEDVLWGLGVGCEGAMDVLLLRVGPQNDWQPLAAFAAALASHEPVAAAVAVESSDPSLAVGSVVLSGDAAAVALQPDGGRVAVAPALAQLLDRAKRAGAPQWLETPRLRVFATPLALPPRLLLLGAGPDTLPLVEFAARLGWKVTLNDHRPAYADPRRFPGAARVLGVRPQELASALALDGFDAVVVMSHHLPSDLEYLRALAASAVPYVGLLGPAARRERLLEDLGAEAAGVLRPRLRAPVGLAIGGRTPESIALAIVAEIHAWLHGEAGGPFHGGESGAIRAEPGASR